MVQYGTYMYISNTLTVFLLCLSWEDKIGTTEHHIGKPMISKDLGDSARHDDTMLVRIIPTWASVVHRVTWFWALSATWWKNGPMCVNKSKLEKPLYYAMFFVEVLNPFLEVCYLLCFYILSLKRLYCCSYTSIFNGPLLKVYPVVHLGWLQQWLPQM